MCLNSALNMTFNLKFVFIFLNLVYVLCRSDEVNPTTLSNTLNNQDKELNYLHSVPISSHVFPYVAAILKKSIFLCTGALISDVWVLSSADDMVTNKNYLRLIRVRLGSTNYKEDGFLLRISYFEIHPFFDDTKPEYDVAMLKLAEPAMRTLTVKPIRILRRTQKIGQHFVVTSWDSTFYNDSSYSLHLHEVDEMLSRRVLRVSHMHPMNSTLCSNFTSSLNVRDTKNLLCLEINPIYDQCKRTPGAPVALNGKLWGVMSSWTLENCAVTVSPALVNLASAPDIGDWVRATLEGQQWVYDKARTEEVRDDEDYYEDDAYSNLLK